MPYRVTLPDGTAYGKLISDESAASGDWSGFTLTYVPGPSGGTSTTASTTGGVAIDPTVSQSQWLLNYLLSAKDRGISQFGADTSRMGTLGNLANTQYGNETSRAGVVGNLYSTLFGTPANYGAVSNLMRGQPNASGLSFWNALASRSHLGEGATDPRGQLHNVNPDQVISDLFGGVAASGRPKSSGSSGSGGGSNSSNGAYSAGSGTQPSAAGQGSTVQGHVRHSYGSYDGLAGGGDIVVQHPATLHLADGRVIPIGEYGRPEQLTVTPLATNPLPPRYYAGLMPGNQQNGMLLYDNNGPPGTEPLGQREIGPPAGQGGGTFVGANNAVPRVLVPYTPDDFANRPNQNLNDRARPGRPLHPLPQNGMVFHSEMIGSNTAGDNQDPLYGVPPNQLDQFGQAGVGPGGQYAPAPGDDGRWQPAQPIPSYRGVPAAEAIPNSPFYQGEDRGRAGSASGLAMGGTLPLTDAESPTEAALPSEEPDVTNPTPDPQTLAEITAVLHTPPALHPSPTEQAIRANWTLDARGHPQFTGAQQQQQAPQVAGVLPGMATGGALTFGSGAPAVLYPGTTVKTSASAPTDTGQVTSAGTHAGQTSTGPYYNRSPWNDPRYAQTQDVNNLSPLEKSLLESTTAAMGLPASEWWAVYQRSRPSFQNAAVGAGFTRAA